VATANSKALLLRMRFNLHSPDRARPGRGQSPEPGSSALPPPVVALPLDHLQVLEFAHHTTTSHPLDPEAGVLAQGATTWVAQAAHGRLVSIDFDWALVGGGVLMAVDPALVRSNVRLVDPRGLPVGESMHRIALATVVHRMGWHEVVRFWLAPSAKSGGVLGQVSGMTAC
jgi:hypothetical protein